MDKKYDCLKIENQLCFPLYAASKEVTKKYQPFLEKLDLTYTQYIVLLVLWEYGPLHVKELGEYLYLDSGTLTPLLKKLEKKGIVERVREKEDNRNVLVSLTKKGTELKEEAKSVPSVMGKCIPLSQEEAKALYKLLYKILEVNENGQK